MNDSTLHCPKCNHEIKLTESLAAPILAATRASYEARLADKDKETSALLEAERSWIADEESKKARLLLGQELEAKAKILAETEEVLRDRDSKLAAAQASQAELLRKQRELEDAKRALDLTVEQRVQASVTAAREMYEKQLADKDMAVAAREKAAQDKLQELERARLGVDQVVAQRLAAERQQIAEAEGQRVRQTVAAELELKNKALADANEVLKDRETKLAAAQAEQAELLKKQRELDDARRELEVTVERRVQATVGEVRVKAKQEAEDGMKLILIEKEEQMAGMLRQIEDLKRKGQQGSQQLQGEALELELEAQLRSRFPLDQVEPVPKGEFGGDVVQHVMGPGGVVCGTILWESKRTRNWSDGWLPKLRDDQRRARADVAVLISDVLPKPVEAFDHVEGIWVTERRCAMPVAIALRQMLVELQGSRLTQEGQQTKTELLYAYLTGPQFRHRIEAIVEKFGDMQADLAREKKATIRLWAKREAQINGMMEATVGMYGDMQGIAGRAMQEIPAMELPLLEARSSEDPELP